MSTTKRGRVLRDTSGGEGLVFVEGQQYPFRLEGTWRSEFAPKLNQAVDAEFDDSGKLIALRAAGPATAGASAGAQASETLDAAGAAAKKLAEDFKAKGVPVILEWAQRVGYAVLIAWVVLLVSWMWLPVTSVNMGMFGGGSISFYDSLIFLNGLIGGRGIYGFLAWVALLAVFLPQVWKDPKAGYGMMLPLAFMILVAVIAWAKAPSREELGPFADSIDTGISFGVGLYLGAAAAIFLAFRGFMVSRGAAAQSQPA